MYLFIAAAKDHSSADCLLVAVMTHGDPGILHCRDTVYRTQELWLHFTGDKCRSLIGKPKLFFIQVKQHALTYLVAGVNSI
jgi:caspase-like apoptosis-related cysteine protease